MELYIQPNRINKNPITGRFLKGHTPHNKGLKWEDYMDMSKAERVKQIASKNLRGNPNIGGHNKRKVIGIKEGKIIGVFESAVNAARKLNITRRNITHCCQGKRKTCGKICWFYESEIDNWVKYLPQSNL